MKNNKLQKRVFIRTFGCQMNIRDSELVIGQFLSGGYRLTDNIKEADVILFNTCSVRQHAEDKVWSELGTLKKLRSHKPYPDGHRQATSHKRPVIGVIGCMAKNLGDEIIERMPQVDVVCSPNDLGKIYKIVCDVRKKKQKIIEVGSDARDKSFYEHTYHQDKRHCYVNISEGCSNFCSYCVVPYVRGRHRSRPVSDILEEVRQLVDGGISSITLLGQNVNDYQSLMDKKRIDFIKLLDMISDIDGIRELGFVTSHPKDIDASTSLSINPERSRRVDFRLFDLMSQKHNIKKYLHLPVQSGSNRILKLMDRRYTREKYFEIIKQYRKRVPKGILATDAIVGFPTENEQDFGDTLGLFKKIKFDFAYIFKYSPRPHTKAAAMIDDVPLEVKKKRHKVLLEMQKEISRERKT